MTLIGAASGITIGRQDNRLLSTLTGVLTPALRAKIEVVWNAWAAPGVNNPDDEQPIAFPPERTGDTGGEEQREALAEAITRDTRSAAQRNHDALDAMCDWILGHQGLGRPNRIPAQLVITIDEHDLARRAGVAVTSTGTMVPVAELIELAADTVPWLEVFRHATSQVLDFRARPALGHHGPTAGDVRPRPRLHPTRMHRTVLPYASSPRRPRLRRRRPDEPG